MYKAGTAELVTLRDAMRAEEREAFSFEPSELRVEGCNVIMRLRKLRLMELIHNLNVGYSAHDIKWLRKHDELSGLYHQLLEDWDQASQTELELMLSEALFILTVFTYVSADPKHEIGYVSTENIRHSIKNEIDGLRQYIPFLARSKRDWCKGTSVYELVHLVEAGVWTDRLTELRVITHCAALGKSSKPKDIFSQLCQQILWGVKSSITVYDCEATSEVYTRLMGKLIKECNNTSKRAFELKKFLDELN